MSLCHPIDFIRSSFSPYYCRSFDPKWATASTDKFNVERNCLVQVSNRSRSSKRSYSPQPLWRLILPLASFGVTGWLTEFWFQFNSQRHWQSLAFRTGCLTYRCNSISIQFVFIIFCQVAHQSDYNHRFEWINQRRRHHAWSLPSISFQCLAWRLFGPRFNLTWTGWSRSGWWRPCHRLTESQTTVLTAFS